MCKMKIKTCFITAILAVLLCTVSSANATPSSNATGTIFDAIGDEKYDKPWVNPFEGMTCTNKKPETERQTLAQSYQKTQQSLQYASQSIEDWFWEIDTETFVVSFFGLVIGLPLAVLLCAVIKDILVWRLKNLGIIKPDKNHNPYECPLF